MGLVGRSRQDFQVVVDTQALGLDALNQPPEPVEVSGQVEGGGRNDQDTRPPCGPAALSLLLLAGLALAGAVWAGRSVGTAVD